MTDQTKIQDKIVGRVVVTIENNKDTNEPIIIKKGIHLEMIYIYRN